GADDEVVVEGLELRRQRNPAIARRESENRHRRVQVDACRKRKAERSSECRQIHWSCSVSHLRTFRVIWAKQRSAIGMRVRLIASSVAVAAAALCVSPTIVAQTAPPRPVATQPAPRPTVDLSGVWVKA